MRVLGCSPALGLCRSLSLGVVPGFSVGLLAGLLFAFLLALSPGNLRAATAAMLDNGLTVIAEETRVSPLVAVSVLYKVGSRNETEGQTGVSHFVEHMLFNGTEKYPGGQATKEILKNGGIPIGETWWDYTHFGAVVPSEKLDLALDIEADRMANAVMDTLAIREEREVILEELSMRSEAPLVVLIEDLFASAFKVHPYHHWFPGGYFGDVLLMEPEYVQQFYREHYNPANAVVTIVGNIAEEEAIRKARELFGAIPGGAAPRQAFPEEPEQQGLRRVTVRGPANEARIMVLFKGPAYATRDFEAASVLAVMLGGGRSSLLNQALVDGGRATEAAVAFFPAIDPLGFLVMVSVEKDGDIKACERALYAAIEDFKRQELSGEAVAKAISRVEGLTVLGTQTVRARAFDLGTNAVRGDYKYADRFVENIRSLTADEIMEVAGQYLDWDQATIGWLIPKGKGPENQEIIGGLAPAGDAFRVAAGGGGVATDGGVGAGIGAGAAAAFAGPCVIGAEGSGAAALSFTDARFEDLPNGITLMTKEDHSLPVVALSSYVLAGSAYEPPGKSGLARLTAMTVAMGSANYPYRSLYDTIETLGSDLTAESDLERAYLSTAVLSSQADQAARILCDLLASPSFRSEDFKRAKRELLSDIAQLEEDATETGRNKLREAYYAGHPYSRPEAGTTDAVEKLTLRDVKAFYDSAYLPGRTVIAAVGDFNTEEIRQLLVSLLSRWQPKRAKGAGISDLPALTIAPGFSQHVQTLPEKKQAKIFWGMRAPGIKDPRYEAFQVMNFIVGGQAFGSRLFDRIREKESLAYVVHTDLDLTSQPSSFHIYLGTRPKNVSTAIEAVREEVGKFAAEGPTAQEMDDTKSFLRSLLPFQMQTYAQIGQLLLNLKFFGLPLDYYETYGARLDKVTAADVLDAGRTYLNLDNSCLAVTGPVDQNLEALRPSFKRSSKER